MDAGYWHQRWAEGRTGWHRDDVMPLLAQHWPALGVPAGANVLVPLCGKSLDMHWLAAQGHDVLGIELDASGIHAFFDEASLAPTIADGAFGRCFRHGRIEILQADIFDVPASRIAECTAVYDRAALFALPAEMRVRYAEHVYGALPRGARGLLITLEYPQQEKSGPPFSVDDAEVHRLFADGWQLERIDHRDILSQQPQFIAEGVSALHTAVYSLAKPA